MAAITMKALLETGVHFGHRTRRWNPKMKPYIFTERNGIHIIDLQQTMEALDEAYAAVRDTVARGGILLFVGTKRQAKDTIAEQAQRCEMPYVNERWLGGTLTNWRTIRQRIDQLIELEARRDRGEFDRLTKKEALRLARKIEKLNRRLGGIKHMERLPDMLYIVDVRREATAVREANSLGIPIVALVDTNCDPDPIDYVIPSNDDAIRAIKLLTTYIADAVLEGLAMRKEFAPELVGEEMAPEQAYAAEDELYLGEATLAKLREGVLAFEEEIGGEEVLELAVTFEEEAPIAAAEADVVAPNDEGESVAVAGVELAEESKAEEVEEETAPAGAEPILADETKEEASQE
ncbi:MAG: 30S ribosomal protein S2 [Chloroflexi bacterium]|nr:MAG: 30S ribosomal protein S2 [Chloroflexota bacterium]